MRQLKLLCLCLLLALTAGAQTRTPEDIEQELIRDINWLDSLRFGEDYDTLYAQNALISDKLKSYMSLYPATLDYSFSKLDKETQCMVITSADGKFRIYSWDTYTGGTMHFYSNVFQYRKGKQVMTAPEVLEEEGDQSGFFSEIYTLKAKSKTYYLALCTSIYSTRDIGQYLMAYQITPDGLSQLVKLFESEDGPSDVVGVGLNFFSVVDRPERPLKLVIYNTAMKTISVPITGDDDNITDQNRLYRFDGKIFRKIK